METLLGGNKILVVEDNRMMARVLYFNLQRSGFDVTVAYNGVEATQQLDKSQFDMIITDYEMPLLGGEGVCLHARSSDKHATIPIVLLSAKCFELDIPTLTEKYGLTDVLFKPFSPREIDKLAKSVLQPIAS